MLSRKLFYIVLLCVALPLTEVWAQIDLNPYAVVLRENGVEPEKPDTIHPGDSNPRSAPLELRFFPGIESPPATLRYEWQFAEDAGFNIPNHSPRFDQETVMTFEEAGRTYIRLLVTDTGSDEENEEVSGTIVIQITESELDIPNAFSPNGDGINDVFKVKYKSLVSFNAVVFNRWAQKMYDWGMDQIDDGWDGTAHGHQVPNGVYFIVIEARGADGVVYKHKGDINILR